MLAVNLSHASSCSAYRCKVLVFVALVLQIFYRYSVPTASPSLHYCECYIHFISTPQGSCHLILLSTDAYEKQLHYESHKWTFLKGTGDLHIDPSDLTLSLRA